MSNEQAKKIYYEIFRSQIQRRGGDPEKISKDTSDFYFRNNYLLSEAVEKELMIQHSLSH